MTFFGGMKIGFNSYGKAFSLLFKKRLWLFLLFPFVFNILLFWGGYALVDTLIDYVKEYIFGWTSLENADYFLSDYLKMFVSGFIYIIFKFLYFFLFSYFGAYIILIIMSPIFAILSEKTESLSTGKSYPFDIQQMMRDIVRGILIALRNLIIEILIVTLVLIVSIIPIFGWIIALLSPVFLFIVSSYFYGFSFMDYNSERRHLNPKQSIALIRKYKGVAIANGIVFSFSLILPFLGVLFASFFAIVSVISASLSMEEIFKLEKL